MLSARYVSLSAKVNRGVAWAAGAQAVIAIADLVSQLLVIALWVSSDDYGIAFAAGIMTGYGRTRTRSAEHPNSLRPTSILALIPLRAFHSVPRPA